MVQIKRSARQDSGGDEEVDDDFARLARDVGHLDAVAEVLPDLFEQGQGIVVVAEAHYLALAQRVEGAEDGGVAEALGDTARVEWVDAFGTGGTRAIV